MPSQHAFRERLSLTQTVNRKSSAPQAAPELVRGQVNLARVFGIVLLCLMASIAPGQSTNLDQFVPALRALQQAKLKDNLSDFSLTVAKMGAKGSGPEHSWASIVELWAAGQHDFIELLWWQKDDRETRAFIVALYWCSHPPPREDAQDWPASVADFNGHAGRFASPERELRVDETRFVRKHLSAIASELAKVLEKSKSPNAVELAKRYADIARKGEGESLPKLDAVK